MCLRRIVPLLLTAWATTLAGCSDWTAPHPTQSYLAAPGQYAPPAEPLPKLKVAVPALAVEGPTGIASDVDPQALGADELFALLDASARFDLTERIRLTQLLSNQGLTDMIAPGRLVHPGAIHGVEYLMFGQVRQLSVQKEPPPAKATLAGVEQMLHVGPGYVPKIIVSAKVDLQMVDAHTGAVAVAGHGGFQRTSTPGELGLQMTSDQLSAMSQVSLNATDTRTVMRLVLDDTLRPMIPRLDRWAAALQSTAPSHEITFNTATQPAKAGTPVFTSATICPECGAKVGADQEFCPNCGHKVH
jgi:curli biogenesis system outer membrane secretion channel CsgG